MTVPAAPTSTAPARPDAPTLHPLSLIALAIARLYAPVPEAVRVEEQRQDQRLHIYIHPGEAENAPPIIGRGGGRIGRVRGLVEELGLQVGLWTKVYVVTDDREATPASRNRGGQRAGSD